MYVCMYKSICKIYNLFSYIYIKFNVYFLKKKNVSKKYLNNE